MTRKKSENPIKSEKIEIRVTAIEKKIIQKAAIDNGEKPTKWMLKVLLAEAKKQ